LSLRRYIKWTHRCVIRVTSFASTMAVPKRILLLSSAAFTFVSFRYAPAVSIFPRSYFKNTATLFAILLFAQWFWNIIVYPLFLSPLRHLPTAPVSFRSDSANISFLGLSLTWAV
jgi:hypothetical protein